MATILDEDFKDSKTVQKDSRGRIAIGSVAMSEQYRVSRNSHGQILLTPVVQIPEHEAWVWANRDAIESIRRGVEDAAAGRVESIGSFATFVDVDVEDE